MGDQSRAIDTIMGYCLLAAGFGMIAPVGAWVYQHETDRSAYNAGFTLQQDQYVVDEGIGNGRMLAGALESCRKHWLARMPRTRSMQTHKPSELGRMAFDTCLAQYTEQASTIQGNAPAQADLVADNAATKPQYLGPIAVLEAIETGG